MDKTLLCLSLIVASLRKILVQSLAVPITSKLLRGLTVKAHQLLMIIDLSADIFPRIILVFDDVLLFVIFLFNYENLVRRDKLKYIQRNLNRFVIHDNETVSGVVFITIKTQENDIRKKCYNF